MKTSLRAELTRSNIATAEGITARAESPVLALCRKLIEAGYDPATPLNAYRGQTPALRGLGIGAAPGLRVTADGTGRPVFVRQESSAATSKRLRRPSVFRQYQHPKDYGDNNRGGNDCGADYPCTPGSLFYGGPQAAESFVDHT